MSGKAAKATRSQGERKPSEPIMLQGAPAFPPVRGPGCARQPSLQEQQPFRGGAIRMVDGEGEPGRAGEAADQVAMCFKPRAVFRSQAAGALGQPGVARLRIAELQPAFIRERLLGGIEDLQEVQVGAAARRATVAGRAIGRSRRGSR
jgi:hypothetical protein